jgi:UDP-N-acetylmuramoyl-tripeptide--D-alanyl-D-alanine ligase
VRVIPFQHVIDSTGATLLRGDASRLVGGISTDTRSLKPSDVYVALSGPNFDGNQFAAQAARLGAGGLLLRGVGAELPRELPSSDLPIALHPAPRRALADLAAWHRSRLACHVVGITGSCGKTTTKNLVAQLLATQYETVASPGSFNNDVGVPHSILLAGPSTRALVLEIGTNHPGEIAALCRIARPTVGVITNVGASHLEGLGSVEGVAREKSDLFASLPAEGVAVLNLDSPFAARLRAATRARTITISVEGDGELDAREPFFHSGGTTFRLLDREITSPLLGLHNLSNLLAAIAVCQGLGIDLDRILPAISRLSGARRRMERHDLGDLTVFDDTYNANPESARAAVRVLAGMHGGRRVLVLGDMLELGELAPELHHAIGREAAECGLGLLVLVGELTRATAAGALEAGLDPARVVHLGDAASAAAELDDLLRPGDVVLLKGSRRVGLDRAADHLLARRVQVGAV